MTSHFTVIHSLPTWLPQTEPWVYNQVRFLPSYVDSRVVCKWAKNLDQFPWEGVYSLDQLPLVRQLWNRGLVGTGIRNYFGHLIDVAQKYDNCLLHSHFGNTGWANLHVAKKLKIPHVVTFYGMDVGQLPKTDPRWIKRYHDLFVSVDRVLCEGPFMAQKVVELGCPEDKVSVQHLGVVIDEIPYQPRSWNGVEPLKVLMAASFREKKGFPYGLAALARLANEFPLEVTLIGDAGGTAPSQLEKQAIMAVIEKNSMQKYVRLLGYQPYEVLLREAYQHHLFLAPSVLAKDGDSEGGAPVVLIDMAASGMPIVSTRHCDISEIIIDGKTGLLAEERNVDDLESKLRWMLAHRDQWGVMLHEGRRRVEDEFNATNQGARLGEIYKEIIETRRAN